MLLNNNLKGNKLYFCKPPLDGVAFNLNIFNYNITMFVLGFLKISQQIFVYNTNYFYKFLYFTPYLLFCIILLINQYFKLNYLFLILSWGLPLINKNFSHTYVCKYMISSLPFLTGVGRQQNILIRQFNPDLLSQKRRTIYRTIYSQNKPYST